MFIKLPVFIRLLIVIFIANIIFVLACSLFSKPAISQDNDKVSAGHKLFKANCSGCHLNGKNLIKPDKPIISSSKLKSKQTFKDFLSSPPPPMPNFKTIANNNTQFNELYSYVISLMGK